MLRAGGSRHPAFALVHRERPEETSLTQEELAARADVSARFVSLLETSRRQPSLSALFALSEGLGLSMAELIRDAERRYRDGRGAER